MDQLENQIQTWRKQMLAATGNAVDRLEAERYSLQGFLEFTQKHPGLYRIVQEAQFVDEAVFREYYERLAKGYSEGLSEAVRRGEIGPGDAEARNARALSRSARHGEMNATSTISPASTISRATSATRRRFSIRSAAVNPRSLLSPWRTLSPSSR